MTVHLVTFSDESMSRAAQLCIESAARIGGVDDSLRWHYDDFVKTNFYKQNIDILSQPRGLGFWAWKPWIIDRAMDNHLHERQFLENSITKVNDGDILIYADAGVEFIDNVNHIISRMDQDIFLFGNNWEHAHWCKRDVVASVWPASWNLEGNKPRYPYPVPDGAIAYDKYDGGVSWVMFGKQVQASVIFFRVTDWTRAFVAEWLRWCLASTYKRVNNGPMERHGYLIDDSPSQSPNHPEFREHRHDQAILTTMAYREGIKLHYWPSVYNRGGSPEFVYEKLPEYAGDDYPVLFSHHRKRNHEWPPMLGELWANLHPKHYK